MADPRAMCDLWTWCLADRLDPGPVLSALAAATGRPVVALGAGPVAAPSAAQAAGDSPCGDAAGDAIACDVWYAEGDFPTVVDCYFVPAGCAEPAAAGAVARRLATACLFADGTLDPAGHLLATADGVIRAVRATVTETEDGPRWSLLEAPDLRRDEGWAA